MIGCAVKLQPAVAGFRAGRVDAESHDRPGLRGGDSAGDSGAKRAIVGDDVIRRHDQHQTVRIACQMQRRREHGGCGVAWFGLDQDRAGVDADLGELFGDDEAEIGGRDNQRSGDAGAGHAGRRRLKQGFAADEPGKLLGIAFP